MLSKSLSCSRRFNALTESQNGLAEFCQLLYTLLIPHVDDFGRMTGDPFSIKMTVLPASPRPISEFWQALSALHDVGLIAVYQDKGDIWLQVNKFDDHQTGLHKRTESRIPKPSGKFPEIPGNSWSRARAEENRTELKGTEEKSTPTPVVVSSNGVQRSTHSPRSQSEQDHEVRLAMAASMRRPHDVSRKRRAR